MTTGSDRAGQWIWLPPEGLERHGVDRSIPIPKPPWQRTANLEDNVYVLARRRFELDRVSPAILHCSARALYRLFVNGVLVGSGPPPSDPSYAYVDSYDVSTLLRESTNVIACMAWNQGEGATPLAALYAGPPGLFFELTDAEGSVVAASDDRTRVIRAPHLQQATAALEFTFWGFQEVWNYALEPKRWSEPDFDDSDWRGSIAAPYQPATVLPRAVPGLASWYVEPERVTGLEPFGGAIDCDGRPLMPDPVLVDASAPGSWPTITLDFGQQLVGYPEVELEGSNGYVMLSYGESMDLARADTVVPDGHVVWEPYHRRAFRYLRLEFSHFERVELRRVRVRCVNAPLEERGDLDAADDELRAIWELGRRTVRAATQEMIESDAWRERVVYLCGVEHRVSAYSFGVDDVTKETLRQLARIQRDDGAMPSTAPVARPGVRFLPEMSAYWARALRETVMFTGDLQLARELFPSLVRLLEWYAATAEADGLLDVTGKPWWTWLCWARLDRHGRFAPLNFLFHEALLHGRALATLLGEPERAADWEARATALRSACRELFWSPARGAYVDCVHDGQQSDWISQQTNALAVNCGIASPEEGAAFLPVVLDPELLPQSPRPFNAVNDFWGGYASTFLDQTGHGEVDDRQYPGQIGYPESGFDAAWVGEALFRCGMGSRALELVRFHWGEELRRGATTTWEISDPYTQPSAVPHRFYPGQPERVSHCHTYGAGVTYLLSRYLLGAWPLEPGFARVSVAPHTAGLDQARGSVPTPRGPLAIAWHRAEQGLDAALDLPDGVTAQVVTPECERRELGPGEHRLRIAASEDGPI